MSFIIEIPIKFLTVAEGSSVEKFRSDITDMSALNLNTNKSTVYSKYFLYKAKNKASLITFSQANCLRNLS